MWLNKIFENIPLSNTAKKPLQYVKCNSCHNKICSFINWKWWVNTMTKVLIRTISLAQTYLGIVYATDICSNITSGEWKLKSKITTHNSRNLRIVMPKQNFSFIITFLTNLLYPWNHMTRFMALWQISEVSTTKILFLMINTQKQFVS